MLRRKVHRIRMFLSETQVVLKLPGYWASARARSSPPSSVPPSLSSLHPFPPLRSLFHSPFFPRGPGTDVSLSLSNCLHGSEQLENWLWTPPRPEMEALSRIHNHPQDPSDKPGGREGRQGQAGTERGRGVQRKRCTVGEDAGGQVWGETKVGETLSLFLD